MKGNPRGMERKPADQCGDQCQYVSLLGLTIDVNVQAIACNRIPEHFEQIIESALDIDVSRIFDLAVLVDF
jgi:hypothetical protein